MWATAVDHHDLPGLAAPFDGDLDTETANDTDAIIYPMTGESFHLEHDCPGRNRLGIPESAGL